MMNFVALIKNILAEQGKTTQELFKNNIVPENTFYKYTQRHPSLPTLLKICNYLQISIDYLLEFNVDNDFVFYNFNSEIFYNNLASLIENKNISKRQFCEDLNYSKDNLIRWKNGTTPSIQSLIDISQYFKCSIDDLLLK